MNSTSRFQTQWQSEVPTIAAITLSDKQRTCRGSKIMVTKRHLLFRATLSLHLHTCTQRTPTNSSRRTTRAQPNASSSANSRAFSCIHQLSIRCAPRARQQISEPQLHSFDQSAPATFGHLSNHVGPGSRHRALCHAWPEPPYLVNIVTQTSFKCLGAPRISARAVLKIPDFKISFFFIELFLQFWG
jgi:hypothetical protein